MNKLIALIGLSASLSFGAFQSFAFNSSTIDRVEVLSEETTTFIVNGTEACKLIIEDLIKNIPGVSSASWDVVTKRITITFDASLVERDRFYVTLAEAGYDNDGLSAKQAKYDALSTECKYQRIAEED
jgi:periplasmic mercuric ion binding protein